MPAMLLLLWLPAWGADLLMPDTAHSSTTWQDHKGWILSAVSAVLLQALTIAVLVLNRRHRLSAERLLRQSEERYHLRLDAAVEQKRQYEDGLRLMLELSQKSGEMTERQICDAALDIAVTITQSEIGYLHLLDDDQNTISLVTWNAEALKHCTSSHSTHYPIAEAGIWADCARTGQTVIHNDYQNMNGKKTCPEGHSHLLRHMSAPALDGHLVRMIVGVGNKASDYTEEDSQRLQMLANGVQKIVMRHRAELALVESEDRFRFITDLSPSMVWVANTSNQCSWVNQTWLSFSGRSIAQECGNGWVESVHPDDVEPYAECCESHFEARTPFTTECRFRRNDGIYRRMLVIGQPSFGKNETFMGFVGSCADITDLRAVEGQLARLGQAMEQTSQSIILTGLDLRIEYVNQAFCHISGYDAQEVMGKNPRMLRSGMTPDSTYVQMWEALHRGETWQGEFINRRKNGETYVESARISPVRQTDNRITHYLAIKDDVTESKRAAETILQSKILLQDTIDASPDWIFVKDAGHRFVLVNKPFAQAFGQLPETLIGRLDTDFMPIELCVGNPLTGEAGLHALDDAVFRGEAIHLPEERVFLSGDKPRVFETFKTPLRDSQQRIFGNLCYRRDMTDRVIKEQEQRLLARQLQQAQKMELIGQLTGGVAHDFNNILASMLGYAELIEMSSDSQLSPQLHKYLQEILQAGIRAKELVQQLLSFSQKRDTVLTAISVSPIVTEVIKLLRSTLPASIAMTVDLARNLPQVKISAVQLHQILMNLGINARDAIAGGGKIEIMVDSDMMASHDTCSSCHQTFCGNFLVIAVRDSGTGIAKEIQAQIFDPFFSTKGAGLGSGLGLSVVHGIVHAADGHIVLLSALGVGTEFRIYLPAQVASDTAQSRPYHGYETENIRVHAHVMVVDDEAAIVAVATALLENIGCTVTGLTSSTEALRLFSDNPHGMDMVITDCLMPDLDGIELASAMLALRADIPIIMSTGYSASIDEEAALKMGLRQLLLKPVPAKVLLEVVARHLNPKALLHQQPGTLL